MPYSKEKAWLDSLFSDVRRQEKQHNNNAKSATSTDDDSSIFPPIVRKGSDYKPSWAADETKDKKKREGNNNAMLIKKTASADNPRSLLPPIGVKASSSTGDTFENKQVSSTGRRNRPTSLRKPPARLNNFRELQQRCREQKFDLLKSFIDGPLGRVDTGTARAEYNRLRVLLEHQQEKVKAKLEDIDQQRLRIDSLLEESRRAEELNDLPREETHARYGFTDDTNQNQQTHNNPASRSNQFRPDPHNEGQYLGDIQPRQGRGNYPDDEGTTRRISHLEEYIQQKKNKGEHLKDQVDLLIEKYNSFKPRRHNRDDEDSLGSASVSLSADTPNSQLHTPRGNSREGNHFIPRQISNEGSHFNSREISREGNHYNSRATTRDGHQFTPREVTSEDERNLPWYATRMDHYYPIPRSILKLDKFKQSSSIRRPVAGCIPPSTDTFSVRDNTIDERGRRYDKAVKSTEEYLDNHQRRDRTQLARVPTPYHKENGHTNFCQLNQGTQQKQKKKKRKTETKVKRDATWTEEMENSMLGKRSTKNARSEMNGFDNGTEENSHVYKKKAEKRPSRPCGINFRSPYYCMSKRSLRED